jgi:hypothetical protein
VGLSARIYESNSLGDRAKEGGVSERRHAGTGEGINVCIHWRIYIETGLRRVAEAIAGTAHIRCGRGLTPSCMSVGASIVVVGGVGGVLRGSSDVSKGAKLDMFDTIQRLGANAGGSHLTKHPWSLLQGVYATCETRRLRALERDQACQSLIARTLPRMASKPE